MGVNSLGIETVMPSATFVFTNLLWLKPNRKTQRKMIDFGIVSSLVD
jgi:hypothetical protein